MHPFVRIIAAQVADPEAAWTRLEQALYPAGVECPTCDDRVVCRTAVAAGPPYRYDCAVCDRTFSPLIGPAADIVPSWASWDVWLEQMTRSLAFGPKSRRRPPGQQGARLRRIEAIREVCDGLVARQAWLVEAIFGLEQLPEPLQGPSADESGVVISLPQPDTVAVPALRRTSEPAGVG